MILHSRRTAQCLSFYSFDRHVLPMYAIIIILGSLSMADFVLDDFLFEFRFSVFEGVAFVFEDFVEFSGGKC